MGFLSRLLGKEVSESTPETTLVNFEGFTIKPAPKKQHGSFVTAGYIYRPDASGENREHFFIRADTHSDFETACQHSVFKAKQIINESGERIFDRD